jgi:hypothetical protein
MRDHASSVREVRLYNHGDLDITVSPVSYVPINRACNFSFEELEGIVFVGWLTRGSQS